MTTLNASEHSIKSVTVYRTAAEVVRPFALDLKAGRNTVHVAQLSSSIDSQSLRVSHLSGSARVIDVQCTVDAPNAAVPANDSVALLARKRELEDERKVLEQGLSLFVDYARTLNSAHTAPGDAVNFLDAFMAGRRSTVASIRKLDDEIAERGGRVTFVIIAAEACSAGLEMTYKVNDASWEPYYDLHATTVSGQPASTVSLHCNVRVKQTSGEDWNDTDIAFVTSSGPRQESDADTPSLAGRKVVRIPTGLGGFGAAPATAAVAPAWLVGAPASMPSSGGSLFGHSALTGTGTPTGAAINIFQSHSSSDDRPASQQSGGFGATASIPAAQQPRSSLFGSQAAGNQQNTAAGTGWPSAFGQVTGGGLFGKSPPSTTVSPAQQTGYGSQPKPSSQGAAQDAATDKAALQPKPQIDDGSNPGNRHVSDMRVTAVGEKITIRESTPAADVRLSAAERASIPSDGAGHAVPIASLALDAAFMWVCVPRSRAAAFVECRSRNTSTHTLVAGPLTVYVDGKQVAKTTLKDVKPQETFVAPLGVDDAVRVLYRRTARTEERPERPFVERIWTTACTARYAVTNGHSFALPEIRLRDALPVSVNPQIALLVKSVRERDLSATGTGPDEWEVTTPAGVSWEETPVMRPPGSVL
ncbi:uncharacterized protein B0H18DRAFT_995178 [Fomitopsis serialis]|uniref:uncharacterized protein n=1 Tax=Fomitopsis serialis TaxID=139415 RepID=UPI002007B810|nr:uncharacterized protein B0H18DRAFT_995178 [Neoantrodia serialis]KAH9930090.1 hypothetical protein B0H18DRAFT_995178 [Neoantrodia serialis]